MADKNEKQKSAEEKTRGEKQKLANLKRHEKTEKASARLSTGTIEKLTEAPRVKTRYFDVVLPEMLKARGKGNRHQIPRLAKIVVNMGISEARDNIQALDSAREDLAAITGQRPEIRRAKKSISNFKLRQGMPIGVRVTLRGIRMYEFYDRFIMTAVPRIRDFRGLPPKGFDGGGNYNLGLKEHHVFSEVDLEKSPKALGMNITFVTTSKNDKDALDFLTRLGMPFKKDAASKE